jgi:hypothetical protein
MTEKQKKDFLRMHLALKTISRYMTLNQLKRQSRNRFGLEYPEALEIAYENVVDTAKAGAKGVKLPQE